jgi:hypothetical protein
MREAIGWLIEQLCRLADTDVCLIANLTDHEETESTGG